MSYLIRASLVALLAAPSVLSQSVLVVDATGAGDFTDLQAAVDAAAAGDIVLVRSTLNPGATINGKGLTLVGEVGGAPDVGRLSLQSLPAGQTLTVRHLSSSSPDNMFEAMKLGGNLGTVFLEDVYVAGSSGGAFHLAAKGLRVEDCAAVVVNNSHVWGGYGNAGSPYWGPKPGGEALLATNSNVAASWVDFHGGGGDGVGPSPFLAVAGDGINVTGGYLFLSGSKAIGGPNPACDTCGGDIPSDGLQVQAGGLAEYTDTIFTPGTTSGAEQPGQDIDANPGAALNLNGIRRALFVSSPLRFLEKGVLIYWGAPYDRVTVFASASTAFAPNAGKVGVWSLGQPEVGPLLVGVADDLGKLKTQFHAPDLAPAEGLTIFLQAAVIEMGTGALRFSGPTSLTLIDPVF